MLSDLDEDYEAIYKNGERPDISQTCNIPVGRCSKFMCSDEEMQERERNSRLNKYEVLEGSNPPQVDKNLALSEYKRPGAGRQIVNSEELRPWSCLKRALHHLLFNICVKRDDWMYISDFVFDRLRAIRQDMIVQRIQGRRYIEVLEGSIRFLVYSMYRLTCTLSDYSQVEPFKAVITPTGRVAGLNNYELNVVREMKLTMKCLRDCINSLIIQYQENVSDSPNRPLFEALNLIVNLPFMHGSIDCATQFQSDDELRNSDAIFMLVFRMYCDHLSGWHWTALKKLPLLREYPLLVLAYAPVLAQLQIDMVQSLKKMYSAPGSNRCPVQHLCTLICPGWLEVDEEERLQFGKFVAQQFGFYDEESRLCEFKINRPSIVFPPRDFVEKAKLEQRRSVIAESDNDNETRIYAMQMIFGKDWSFYQELLKVYGIESVLDPTVD